MRMIPDENYSSYSRTLLTSGLTFLRILTFSLVGILAFPLSTLHALDWEETAFGNWEGYGLDATLNGEELLISSYNRVSGAVVFSEKIAGSWTNTEVETNVSDILYPPETETTIVLDGSGSPHIFYYKHSTSDLKHAYKDGGAWVNETVDANGSTGGYAEAITCGVGIYCVCYKDLTNGNAMFATGSAGSWTTETIDNSADDVGSHCDLVKVANGDLYVAYYDETNQTTKVAKSSGGSWSTTTLGNGIEHFGMWNSFGVDSDGTLTLVSSCAKSTDTGESDCGYYLSTLAGNGTWTSWEEDNSTVGGHPSMTFASDGRRFVLYRTLLHSALFGHYSGLMFAQEIPGNSAERSTIDGSNFCFGTFLYNRLLRTPSNTLYALYHRSYGACGGNTAQIVVKTATVPPLPTPTPTPDPTATPPPDPTPTPTPGPEAPTPTPSDGGDPGDGNDGGQPSYLSYPVVFKKSTGAFDALLELDNPLSGECSLEIEFANTRTFTSPLSYSLDPSTGQPIALSGRNSSRLLKTNRRSSALYTRAKYSCDGRDEVVSETVTLRPKTTRVGKRGQSSSVWITKMIESFD